MTDVVLVTGGHGVIGSWVCRELARRGANVLALDVAPSPTVAFTDADPPAAVIGDVRDAALVREVFDRHGVTRLLHLAAIVGQPCEEEPGLAIEVNSLATARLLDAAAEAGVRRVIAMSTKGVLGPLDARHLHPTYEPVPPDRRPDPRSMYETTKFVVERLVDRARSRGLMAAAVRLATTWGPGKSGESHGAWSLHSDIASAAAAGRSSRVDVHPDQGYDLVYYADAAAGLADACLFEGELPRPVYHLGSGRIATMGEFGSAVEAAFPGVRVELGDRLPPGRNCLLDIGPATDDFGYRPAFDVGRALADLRARATALPGSS